MYVVVDEEEKRRGCSESSEWWAHRIFLGRVDQVETELELARSQATNQAVGMNAPTTRHLGTACAIEPHPRRTTAESPPM